MTRWKITKYTFILFFIAIYAVPVVWFASGGGAKNSPLEGRALKAFPSLSYQKLKTAVKRIIQQEPIKAGNIFFNQFLNRSFQISFEKASADQMLLRMPFIRLSTMVDRGIISLSYILLDDPAVPVDMKNPYYVMDDGSTLIIRPSTFNSNVQKQIDRRIQNYTNLIESNPEISFSLFYIELLQNSKIHPLNDIFPDADRGQALQYFQANLPDGLGFGMLPLSSMDDFYTYYYRTDHHWNVHGVLKGYEIIYDVLSKNYPGISPILEHNQTVTIPEIKYIGSYARISLYLSHPEEFEIDLTKLPDCTTYSEGQSVIRNHRDEYQAGEYPTGLYISHYAYYFGTQYHDVVYECDSQLERNLLIIGSSYSKGVAPYLAAHYWHTYTVDLRQDKDFSLSKFLKEHPVEDVMIIGPSDVAFTSDDVWMINP